MRMLRAPSRSAHPTTTHTARHPSPRRLSIFSRAVASSASEKPPPLAPALTDRHRLSIKRNFTDFCVAFHFLQGGRIKREREPPPLAPFQVMRHSALFALLVQSIATRYAFRAGAQTHSPTGAQTHSPTPLPTNSTTTEDVKLLFEVRADPGESVDRSNSSHAETLIALLESRVVRAAPYRSKREHLSIAGRGGAYEACGGVCPYRSGDGGSDPFGDDDATPLFNSPDDLSQGAWRPPHIVLMLADDLGWNDLDYSSTWLADATPTLSGLARKGIKLERHYTCWQCAPTRASLLTGRYVTRIGYWTQEPEGLPLNETILAEVRVGHAFR